MPVMDEFQEFRDKVKKGSLKDKLEYFWYYYKTHTIVTILIIALGTSTILDILKQKDDAFFAVLLNSAVLEEEQTDVFIQDFAEYSDIDLNEYNITMDNSIHFSTSAATDIITNMNSSGLSASEKLLVYTASGEVDVIIANSQIFPNQAVQEMFFDLRTILTEEQIAKYEPFFYYIDQTYLDTLAAAEENRSSGEALDPSLFVIPDPTKPEEMEQPIPVGLLVTDSTTLSDAYLFGGDYTVLGVMVNAPHLEDALEFIDYLFE